MSPDFTQRAEEQVRDLLRERAELVVRIDADLGRVEAIDVIVRRLRAATSLETSRPTPSGSPAGAFVVHAHGTEG